MFVAALVEYKNISKKTLQESIESEMSGELEKLLVAVGKKDESHYLNFFWPLTLNSGPFLFLVLHLPCLLIIKNI